MGSWGAILRIDGLTFVPCEDEMKCEFDFEGNRDYTKPNGKRKKGLKSDFRSWPLMRH